MLRKLIQTAVLGSLALSLALPVLAEDSKTATAPSKPAATIDAVCMQTAVEKRDSAIIAAVDANAAAQKSALTVRKDALKAAWAITDRKARRTALRQAWNAFTKASRDARRTLRSADHAVWKQFYTDRKACGSAGASEDPGTEGHDAQL